jgi:hypothetical protein
MEINRELVRFRGQIKLGWLKLISGMALKDKEEKTSSITMDVVIPVIEKDMGLLVEVVESLRKNVGQPIDHIFIIAPESDKIKYFCNENNCNYVNEEKVMGFKKDEIGYRVNGRDRSGWIYQQLIKLNCNKISTKEYILLADSDTILVKKQIFVDDYGKMYFDMSDEFHVPYYKFMEKYLGIRHQCGMSFVSHHMIIRRSILKKLKKVIEDFSGNNWQEVIIDNLDRNELSCFSEYETYGNYLFNNYKNKIYLNYWDNLSLKRMTKKIPSWVKTISIHSYNK